MKTRFRPAAYATTTLVAMAAFFLTGCRILEGKGTEGKKGATSKKADATPGAPVWNAAVLAAIEKLPLGGGYSVGGDAKAALEAAVAWEGGKPVLRSIAAQPSFCSGATYLVFTIMLAQQQRAGRLTLTPAVWRKLVVEGQGDGEGVWGRWNANGPGTARLFHELGLGRSFTDWKEARPGDFLKLFWNESIGAQEKGHSVVFIERGVVEGEEMVTFWSSNDPGGYSVKQVPMRQVKRAVFSRLEHPERLSKVAELPEKDAFLASLVENSVSPEEAAKACGLRQF